MQFFRNAVCVLIFILAIVLVTGTLEPETWRIIPFYWGVDPSMHTPLAELVSGQGVLAIIFGLLTIFTLVFGLWRFAIARKGKIAFLFALVFLVGTVGHFAIKLNRGLNATSNLGPVNAVEQKNQIRLLTYNTHGGDTTAVDIARLVLENKIDVVALEETPKSIADQLHKLLADRGLEFQVFDNKVSAYSPDYFSNILLVGSWLGKYKQTTASASYAVSVQAKPVERNKPVFQVVHIPRPTGELWEAWSKEINQVVQWCNKTPNAIVAGDFNATLDHGPLRNLGKCKDAAVVTKVGGLSTWPTSSPDWLGSAIDHVLVDANTWKPMRGAVVSVGESDHRGLMFVFQKIKP